MKRMASYAQVLVLFLGSTISACSSEPSVERYSLGEGQSRDRGAGGAQGQSMPSTTPGTPGSADPCENSEEHICGIFSAELISLCLKYSTQDDAGRKACFSNRWNRRFHYDLAKKLTSTADTAVSQDQFDRVMPHILKWEGGCSDHPSDRGGRTFMGITTARARQNGWSDDVCKLSRNAVLGIYRKDYWEPRARFHPWPLNLAVMNTEVNSGGGTSQTFLERMKSHGVGGDAVAMARWFVDQQTALYHWIVARNSSQRVFLAGWLNRSTYMQQVIAGAVSLALTEEAPPDTALPMAKAFLRKEDALP